LADPSTSLGTGPGAPHSGPLPASPHGVAVAEHAHAHHPRLQHHFYSMEQQLEASILGMWVFLVTEIMFFGGLFMAYIVYRTMYPQAWLDGSSALNVPLGAVNTSVLICSSLTMVLAVRSAQVGSRRGQIVWLIGTILFGTTFLVVKYFEYSSKFEHHLVPGPHFSTEYFEHLGRTGVDPFSTQLFFSLYFIMTGIHAAHMVVGIGLMSVILWMAWRGRFTPEYYGPIEISGLYWHFVDIVWIFLFPLLYLLGLHGGHGA
jgi:cytochrome c oxidase subunit III